MKNKPKKEPKLKNWTITRIVKEVFEVRGVATREEALDLAEDPAEVTIIRETAKPQKDG